MENRYLAILHENISLSVLPVSNKVSLSDITLCAMLYALCLSLLYPVVVQAIFLEAVPHGTKVDAKQFGRFLFDSLRSIQGFQEQGSFNLFNHLLKVNPIRRNVEIDGTPFGLDLFVQVRAEMLGDQFIPVSEGDRALNDVLKLADIARILVVE